MKKKFICTILIITLCLGLTEVYASTNTELSKIENNILGYDYPNDTNSNRLARLEKLIYGKEGSGDVNKRVKKLTADISADVIGLEIKPSRDTLLEEENEIADNSVEYPIVDEIEQKIFNKTYKNRDFHSRIVAIEKKLFGKIYDVDDYSTRMDRIKSKLSIETIADKTISEYEGGEYYSDNTLNSRDLAGAKHSRFGGRFGMPFGQKNYTRQYSNYGDFSNSIPNSDSLEDNLSQMEYDMFGTEFSNESTESRIKRLNSVKKAKKSSSRYDSQKFSQHMSTAMEIGAMILMILAMVL